MKKLTTTLIFLFFFSLQMLAVSQGSVSRLDSLKQLLPKVKGLQRLQILSDISEVYMLQSDFDNFNKNQVILANELSKNYENSQEVKELYYCNQGYYYSVINDLEKSIINYEKVLTIPSNTEKSLQFKIIACNNLSQLFRGLQQFQEALEYLNKEEKIISNRKTDLYTKLVIVLGKSLIYDELYKMAKGTNPNDEKIYFKKAYDGYIMVYNNLKSQKLKPDANGIRLVQLYDAVAGGLYLCNKKNEAERLYDYAQKFLLQNHLYGLFYDFKRTELDVKIKDNTHTASQSDSLLQDINNTINMNLPYHDSGSFFEIYEKKAELLYKMKRYKEALLSYEQAEKFHDLNSDYSLNMATYDMMGNLYERFGNLKKSLLYKSRCIKVAQELLDSNSFEGEKKTQALLEIERMRQAKQLEFEKIKSERNRNYAIMLLLGLILAIVIVVLLVLFNKNLKTRQKLLFSELNYNKEVALKNELDSIYKVKFDIERQKAQAESEKDIAKNLHDDLASGLAAMNFFIKDKIIFATTDKDRKSFSEIKDEVNSMYEGLRKYIHNLYNNKNLVLSVNEYLYDLMRQSEALNSVKFNIKADFQKMDSLLSVFQQNQLYRIIKETVINSLKYSNSSNVNVTIGLDEGRCEFSVEDDGQGFNYTSQQGIGLKNIQDRIGTLGGEVFVKSNPKQGVSLTGRFNYV